MSIFTILFVVLLIAWIMGFSVVHVAGGLIHFVADFRRYCADPARREG